MECSERVLCGTGEVELDPNIVSEEAGKLYSELQVKPLCFSFLVFWKIICHVFLNGINISVSSTILYLVFGHKTCFYPVLTASHTNML